MGIERPAEPPLGAQCALCPAAQEGGLPGKKCTPPKPVPAGIKAVIVVELPSGTDEVHGLLSTDYSGLEFWRMARAAGLKREEIHVTAAMLCRPKHLKKEAPVAAYACAGRLAQELAGVDPSVPIVPLGTIAEGVLTGHANIAKGRGFVWRVPGTPRKSAPKLPEAGAKTLRAKLLAHAQYAVRSALAGRVVLPTLDPRQVLRMQPTWAPLIGVDLKRVARWLTREPGLLLEDEGKQIVCATAAELALELADWRPGGGFHDVVVVDVETAGKDALTTPLQMVGFCDVESGLVVQAYPWRPDMARVVTDFLWKRSVVWHNGESFDAIVLERHGAALPPVRHDTLVMHHAMASHLRQSLDHCVSNYCDSGPWKLKHRGQTKDDKGGFGVRGEDLPEYNGSDVRLNALLWRRMSAEIDERDRAVYAIDMRLAEIARRMRIHGLAVDETRRQALIKACRGREEALLSELRDAVGDVKFEPSKAAHIRGVLYRNRKPRAWTPTGESSTDKGALEAMAREGGPEGHVAKLVMGWRAARDARTEYLEALQPDANGRVHASWRMPSTDTGRPACKDPNFLNMPRIPHCKECGIAMVEGTLHKVGCSHGSEVHEPAGQIRDIYVAAPGHAFVYFDLCFARGTMVDTPDRGPRPIESLKLGDLVWSYRRSNGYPRAGKITQHFCKGRSPVVRVTLDSGAEVWCTPEHKWLVRPWGKRPKERRADQLQPGDRLVRCRKQIIQGREHVSADNAFKYVKTHAAVLAAIAGPKPRGYHIHHRDKDPLNNRIENLEYKPAREHQSEHGKINAPKQWADPIIRSRMVAGLRRAAKENPDWCKGQNNPRWGYRKRADIECPTCGKTFNPRKDQIFCGRKCWGTSRRIDNHKIVAVVQAGVREVWSIAVEPDHNYALGAGVFVMNCQAEMRFAAHIYGDGPMMKACEADVHAGNAAVIFPEHAEVIAADPKGRGKPYRDIAKNIGFAIAYQAGPDTVHAYLLAHGFPDVKREDVERMLTRLHVAYKHFYAWVDFQYRFVKKYGFLRTVWSGRKRTFGRFRVSKPEVSNYHMQAGVADVMNAAIIALDDVIPKAARLVFYQYDSLIYETPLPLVEEVKARIVEHWVKPLTVPAWPASGMREISFCQPIDVHVGQRLSDL